MNEKKAPKVKVVKDGPYLVSGNLPLAEESMVLGQDGIPESWEKGKEYPGKETYALCRCGCSLNLPFCDGHHASEDFDGTETAAHKTHAEMAEKTSGPGLDLTDAECFCAVALFCHRAGDTWTLTEKSADPTCKKTAIEEACACPSGRLIAWEKGSDRPIEPPFEPSVSLIKDTKHNVNGPIWLKGGVPVESADGYCYEVRNRVTLCRCGRSTNKPFCDGAHVKEHSHAGE